MCFERKNKIFSFQSSLRGNELVDKSHIVTQNYESAWHGIWNMVLVDKRKAFHGENLKNFAM